jgi:hypothetical protein
VAHVCAYLIGFLLEQFKECHAGPPSNCKASGALSPGLAPRAWAAAAVPPAAAGARQSHVGAAAVGSCTMSNIVIELLLLQVLQKCCGCL